MTPQRSPTSSPTRRRMSGRISGTHIGLTSPLFWGALAFALLVAFVVTVPVNRWLIAKGKGHAVVHQYHQPSAAQDRHDAHAGHSSGGAGHGAHH